MRVKKFNTRNPERGIIRYHFKLDFNLLSYFVEWLKKCILNTREKQQLYQKLSNCFMTIS